MYITDITHFLDESGNIPPKLPKQARELTAFISLVIEAATSHFPQETIVQTELRCFQKGCHGNITTVLHDENDVIDWQCSDCDNSGNISNWQGDRWDCRGKL